MKQWLAFVPGLGHVLTEALPLWQHYLCWSDVPVPRISVIFSLEELKEIEKDCAVYVGRMESVARHSSISKEEKVLGCGSLTLSVLPFTSWGSGLTELPPQLFAWYLMGSRGQPGRFRGKKQYWAWGM